MAAAATPKAIDPASGRSVALAVTVLLAAMVVNYMDRAVIAVLLDPIGRDLRLSDSALGLLAGLPFALLYALLGVPFARVADVWNRRKLITLAVAGWSVATIACGAATGLFSLFLMRMLVGVGEGAGTPALHSSLAEMISPERRSIAAGLFVLAGLLGGFLGFALGGVLNDAYGWRAAFVIVGAPGLLVALLIWMCVPEVRPAPRLPSATEVLGREALTVFRRLWALPTFPRLIAGFTLLYAAQNGVVSWAAVYVVRQFALTPAEVGALLGAVVLGPAAVASIVGGALGAVLSRRFGIGWLLALPAIAGLVAVPGYLAFVFLDDLQAALFSLGVAGFFGGLMMPPLFATIYSLAKSSDRATAVALVAVFTNVFGLGFGPFVVGILSDLLGEARGLAHSIALVALLSLPGAALLALGAKSLERDASGE